MSRKVEFLIALACVALGICVAAWFAPKDSWKYFSENFLFFWGPQALILGLLCLHGGHPARPAVFSGVALALALYLALFGTWLFSRNHPQGMAWLGYLFSLPGAVVGLIAAGFKLGDREKSLKAVEVGAVFAGATALGILINQTIICSTVMYCLGR